MLLTSKTHVPIYPLFATGKQFPPVDDVERLARYESGKKFYEGKGNEVIEKASSLLKDTPHYKNIKTLQVAVGLIEILCKKPADMLISDAPIFETGDKGSEAQARLNEMVENNDLVQQIYELTVTNGYTGDMFLKTYYSYRQDYSELLALGGKIPSNVQREIIIEPVNPRYVFCEFKQGTTKQVSAVNIAFVEWEIYGKQEVPFLSIERHIPGAIQYKRFRLHTPSVEMVNRIPIATYVIGEEVATGKEQDTVFTGVEYPLVQHIPYKTTTDDFYGESFVERVKDYIIGIQDVLTSISYILARHTDPIIVTPPLADQSNAVKLSGGILEINGEDAKPYYMEWNGKLTDSFQLLEYYINMVFQAAETPQWIFGNVVGSGNQAGGTSHTTEGSNMSRYLPLLSKIRAIRAHVDKAVRTILWTAQELENFAKEDLEGFVPYEPVYPYIQWKDGVPKDQKTIAEGLIVANGNKPILDQLTAVKQFNDVDDETAQAILDAIQEDEKRLAVESPSVFNDGADDILA